MRINRILFLTSRRTSCLQFMCRDLAHGFRKLGKDVEIIQEFYPGEPQDPNRFAHLCDWLQPEMIFQMDHLRSESPEAFPQGPVYASWLQDALPWLYQESVIKGIGKPDLILTSFPGLRADLVDKGYPEKQVHHLAVAANFDLFYPEPIPKEFSVGFPCNVGHPATATNPERYARRTEPVRWLIEAGIPVNLWGEGWEDLDWAEPFYLGRVRNGHELREAYGSCTVILHANSDTNLHQRVFESQACGRPCLMYSLPSDTHEHGILAHEFRGIHAFWDRHSLIEKVKAMQAAPLNLDEAKAIRTYARVEEDYVERCRQIISLAEKV